MTTNEVSAGHATVPSKAASNANNLHNIMHHRTAKGGSKEPSNQNLRAIAYQRLLSRIANQSSRENLNSKAKSTEGGRAMLRSRGLNATTVQGRQMKVLNRSSIEVEEIAADRCANMTTNALDFNRTSQSTVRISQQQLLQSKVQFSGTKASTGVSADSLSKKKIQIRNGTQ